MIHLIGKLYLQDVADHEVLFSSKEKGITSKEWYAMSTKDEKLAAKARKIARKRKLITKKRKYFYINVMTDYGKAMMNLLQ